MPVVRGGRWRQGVPQHVRSQSRRSVVLRFHQDHQVAVSFGSPWGDDAVERSVLEAALKKAQTQAVIPPVTEQIEQTQKFIERARKWVESRMRKGVVGGRRTFVEIAFRG